MNIKMLHLSVTATCDDSASWVVAGQVLPHGAFEESWVRERVSNSAARRGAAQGAYICHIALKLFSF